MTVEASEVTQHGVSRTEIGGSEPIWFDPIPRQSYARGCQ